MPYSLKTELNIGEYRNRLLFGDNRDILPRLPDNSIDLVVTDPPYKNYQSNRPKVNPKQKRIEESDFDLEFLVEQCHRVLKPSRHFYCFCDHHTFALVKPAVEQYFTYKNCLVWVKNNHGSGDLKGNWAPQHEFIIYASKGKRRPLNPPRPSNVMRYSKVPNEKYSHGTAKPVELLKHIIEVSSNAGELALDPYAGVMSTAAACIETGRDYLMIEKDEDFYRRGEERINQLLAKNR